MTLFLMCFVFLVTMIIIFLRPKGLNEAYPAALGAIIVMLTGVVTYPNLVDIFHKIGDASITIIATIVMTVILESFGFFHWSAARLAEISRGSGYRLYWCIQLLCFFMTLLFNNDGSILITTPILILLLKNFQLNPKAQIPYLISGALIATGSSAPIGVSNIVNLIALKIVHMSLYMHTAMMFVPCSLGLLFMSILMYFTLKKHLTPILPATAEELEEIFFNDKFKAIGMNSNFNSKEKRVHFMIKILVFVLLIRYLLFVESFIGVPIQLAAVLGSVILLFVRWFYLRTNPKDILLKIPWQIFVFAFSMYVIIYGLSNVGLTNLLVNFCTPIANQGLLQASFLMGGLITLLSNLFNNHPALMVGTITLTNMGLNPITLKTIYLANIVGSDIGSLLLPIGTLASLLWMNILKKNEIKINWRDYISITICVIPITVVVTLFMLYFWVQALFA